MTVEELLDMLSRRQPVDLNSALQSVQLDKADNVSLQRLRNALPAQYQALVAPYEHRAFARELYKEMPALPATFGLMAMIPGYQVAKMSGLMGSRTPPSMDQYLGGYRGMLEGLMGK